MRAEASNDKGLRCVLVSDFNMGNFAGYLNNDPESPPVAAVLAPYGQVVQTLTQADSPVWDRKPDGCVVWTRPEAVIESFNHLSMHESVATARILAEVDDYSALLLTAAARVRSLFVPAWTLPTSIRGCGMMDLRNEVGMANTLMRMNLRLADNVAGASNIYLLNTQKWIESSGESAFNPKLWYMGKVAFGNKVFAAAVKDLKAALRGIDGEARKLIIVDLDHTLWGGTVGDLGWENIRLGGHDAVGEACVDFQKALKALNNRGVLLGIVSKNEESIALEAIRKRKEMVLGIDDFCGWKINWKDKAQNVVDLVAEVNVGLQSTVFIDDDPMERQRVREALPEVFVPEWPADATRYRFALSGLRCFDVPALSAEDAARAEMYAVERRRTETRKRIGSVDEWLPTLGLKVRIEELDDFNLPRAAQLMNKTSQMNLATRRMTEGELADWAMQGNKKLWVFHVSDKFGDYGLTGLLGLETRDGKGRIADFVLSCRAMGRKVEETMISHSIQFARSEGMEEIYADYVQTRRNVPCLHFLARTLSAAADHEHRFHWDLSRDFPPPPHVEIEYGAAGR